MAIAEVAAAADRVVLGRVGKELTRLEPGCSALGVRSAHPPRWTGPAEIELEHGRVRVVPCVSVLAVLDALADSDADDRVTVILTNLPEQELGDAVLARLHRCMLLEADRYSLLTDVLGARALDPRIRSQAWLVDALIALAEGAVLPPTTGVTVSLRRAIALVTAARLGVEPDRADLPDLISALDDNRVRNAWRSLPIDERAGIVAGLEVRLGPGARVVAAMAERHDNVLAELLVAQVLTAAPATDATAATALGGFTHSRFGAPRPSRTELLATSDATVIHARSAPLARRQQQARLAEIALEELGGTDLAVLSPILPRGFIDRLARAAQTPDEVAFDALDKHQLSGEADHRVSRVRAAARLRRWLSGADRVQPPSTVVEGLSAHAQELAWVDRALVQVRAGDADPRVAAVLHEVAGQAAAQRASADKAFAAALAQVDSTPATALSVESLLPRVVAPLAKSLPVLLLVVDGMSGSVAADLAERLADPRTGWTEIVRSTVGTREAVLAALPSETRYSRTSLFCAALRPGDQSIERSIFASHTFWPAGHAALLHKADVHGRDGADLGNDLESAVRPDGPRVVGVVLNAVDDSLAKGRQSLDPAWRPEDVTGLPQLLDRAAAAGRAVLLTSDHGHVLEYGATYRRSDGGGARWRPNDGAPQADEVTVGGPRMLAGQDRIILAATEDVRYGARAHGYHGGATLAEVAIPLIGLLPPGVSAPEGWVEYAVVPPPWWDGLDTPRAPVGAPHPKPKKATKRSATPSGVGLFELPSDDALRLPATRGAGLVASMAFREAHGEVPAKRAPDPGVFRAIVDALVAAGGRLPLGVIAAAAGASGRNPRGLISAMRRVLNRDSYPVLELADNGRAVVLNLALLDEQFPVGT